MANTENVTYGKPKVAGAVSVAPVGSALPINATAALDVAYKNLGYISEDGLVNADSRESEILKAWGGDTVMATQSGKADTFAFTLIEALNVEVLKFYYGAENVTGDLATGIKIVSNNKEVKPFTLIVDVVYQNALKRIVVPIAKITETGEISYTDVDAVGYEVTVQAFNDENGDSHFEYIQEPVAEA